MSNKLKKIIKLPEKIKPPKKWPEPSEYKIKPSKKNVKFFEKKNQTSEKNKSSEKMDRTFKRLN